MYITENGWANEGTLDDNDRIEYLHDHFHQMLDAIQNDECNLKGHFGMINIVMSSFLLILYKPYN